MDDALRSLLMQHDDGIHWEYPAGFDHGRATNRFAAFASALSAELPEPVTTETGTSIQDASFHSQILLPGGALRFSSFGDMIAFTPDHEIPTRHVEAVVALAVRHGYTLVPTSALETPYDGAGAGSTEISTWWIRFFDWL